MSSQQAMLQISGLPQQVELAPRANAGTAPPEFTRRKNWSQNVLESLRDVIHVLSPELKLLYCSPASREFLGYQPGELTGRDFREYIHVDDMDVFTRDFRAAESSGSLLRTTFRFLRKDGKYVTLETRGHFYKTGFFGSARSVPSEMTRMMNTFLDAKMENEMLKKKIIQARAAAAAAAAGGGGVAQRPLVGASPQTSVSDITVSSSRASFSSNTPGTTAKQQPSSFMGKEEEEDEEEEEEEEKAAEGAEEMFGEDQFEALFNPNVYTQGVLSNYDLSASVSLFTGLHYDLGERSRGISMGIPGELFNALSSTTAPEDAGVRDDEEGSRDTPMAASEATADKLKVGKKRRAEEEAERICTDCGRTDAPEWRRGPKGPKTLCNACSIRWSKSQKGGGASSSAMQE
ncbi:hypothetical protein BDF20DRAFT_914178 [Mycotypha africana]|uniref:uncharacterized protein n=1 Tax=Mycotypha africana TaxID=64632 RepID=UPI0023014F02|nr:uncharacterized protein BDF20DRAFT_914178 [Mycotypha africana]KAI8975215.1 hypothetical protein BDF20DRAFT_914178 [Mycotypha africana]